MSEMDLSMVARHIEIAKRHPKNDDTARALVAAEALLDALRKSEATVARVRALAERWHAQSWETHDPHVAAACSSAAKRVTAAIEAAT